jgi:uncharacterized membrane-anchored protein YhcB (DUF1043 family)
MDPLLVTWVVIAAAVGACAGILLERTRGSAAKRAAKFEADLVQVRSELMRYQEQTKRHFGKSAELLGRMATDYREFLHHFVTGAEELCPNMTELNASGLERPLLDGAASAPAAAPTPAAAGTAPPAASPAAPTPAAPAHASEAAPTPSMPPPPLDSEPLAEDVVR